MVKTLLSHHNERLTTTCRIITKVSILLKSVFELTPEQFAGPGWPSLMRTLEYPAKKGQKQKVFEISNIIQSYAKLTLWRNELHAAYILVVNKMVHIL